MTDFALYITTLYSRILSHIGLLLILVFAVLTMCVPTNPVRGEGGLDSDDKVYPANSFVNIETYMDEEPAGNASGAVIRQQNNGVTWVVTAGHVCRNIEMTIYSLAHDVVKTVRAEGHVMEIVDIDLTIDICIGKVYDGLRHLDPLYIASSEPVRQGRVRTISSPAGVVSNNENSEHNLVGMFSGRYLGDTQFGQYTRSAFSIPSTSGSSGAVILNTDNEIVSITTHAHRDFENVAYGSTWEETYKFLTKHVPN